MPLNFPVPPPHVLQMTLGDKLYRLALLSPEDVRALEALVDNLLARRWPKPPKFRHDRDAA